MTTESLQPSQGFSNISATDFINIGSGASLLESKQQQVAAISDAKKQALDPSITSSVVPYENLSVIDGDTLKNRLTGEKLRLDNVGNGSSLDAYEVPHGDTKTDPARMLKQRQAIAEDSNLPLSYIPDTAVYQRGKAGEEALRKVLQDAQNISVNTVGKTDKYGRAITDLSVPGSDQSLLGQLNTADNNANYHSKYNIVKEGQDLIQKAAEREKATEFSVSDANRETLLGGIANAVAGGAVATSDQIYNMAKSPFELLGQFTEHGITNKQRELSATLTAKQEAAGKAGTTYTPTAEEQAILETPIQSFMRETVRPVLNGERGVTAKDLLAGLNTVDPFQQSIQEKLQETAFVKANITDRLTAYQEGARKIYNSGGSDELHKDAKALYNDSIEPTFVEGVQKIKDGDVAAGSLQVADAIANAGVGIFRVGANNPQAVAEEVVKQIPNSIAASKALLATFLGMYTNTASEVTTAFIKEHGRHPEGKEVDNIQINSALSAVADSYSDKWLVSKPGVARSFVREGFTESGQSFLEQDAAKQGASKIDFAEVYASGVIGSLAGGGTNVATNPVDAIKEAGSAIATTGKTITWAAKQVGDRLPDSVTGAVASGKQAVTDAVGSTTQAVTDSISEVNSSTTTPVVDPLQQSAQATDSVAELVRLLKPENSPNATTTPEGRNAFVKEASRHNAELAKEMFAITDPSTPNTEEGAARAKVLLAAFRENKDKIDGIKAGNPVADTTDADLAKATSEPDWLKRPEDATVQSPDILQAVDRVIRSMRQPDKVSLEQAEALQAKATLTPEQTSVVSAFIATKKASATMTEVNKDVIFGKPGFLGMVEHQAILSDALDQDNMPAAKSALDSFKAFAASQVKKAASLTAISTAAKAKDILEVRSLGIQFAKDFPTAQLLKNQASDAFANLANSVGKEANMLTTAVAEAELHFKLGTTEAKAVVQESGLLTPVVTTPVVNTPVVNTVAQEEQNKAIENRASMYDRLAKEQEDLGDLGFPEDAVEFRKKAEEIRGTKSITNEKPAIESKPVPVVDPIANVVTIDPVINNTAVDQVTTDTSGNAEEDSVTDPVTVVADATVEAVTDTGTTIDSEFRSVNSLQAKSDKRIDRIYKIHTEEVKKDNDPYMTEPKRMKNLGRLLDKELSSRIAGLQISAESKQDLQSRHAEAVKGSNPLDDSRPIIEEVRAIEKEIAKQQTDVFESDNTVEATVDTTEAVPPLEQIKALAAIKNYASSGNLVSVVNSILKANSTTGFSAILVGRVISALEDMPNKPTSLGEYLLDSTRKFIGGKQLSDYYIAKVLDKVSKHSALITTPNFFSSLKDVGVKDALGLNPEQLNGLDKLTGFVNKFADTFKASTFTPLMVDDAEVLNRNPALYFMKEGGRDFDENFVSTLATVAYSWVANNANNLIEHSDEGINRLLGRGSKSKVTAQEYEILGDKQILKSALITSLGKEIASSLGLKFNPKADGAIESKMIEALGIYAVNTLDHMGVLAKSEAVHKDVYLALKKGDIATEEQLKLKATGENVIYFTGVATTVTPKDRYDVTELAENIQTIVDDNRQSKGLLSELFGYAQQRALPLLEAPTLKNMPNIIKRGIKRIPERMRKALHKYASNGFTINMDNHAIYSFLEPEQRLRMLGYNETLEGVHAVNIKSVQGTNRTSRNELEAYDQLIEHLDQQEGKLTTPMFFLSSVWKSGRAGMEGLINPQASKFHRHMLGMAAWESTIDSPAKLKLFKIAVAEALGSKVDRQGDETSLEDFVRLTNQPEIRDGIATIKYLKSGLEMSAEEKLDAQEAILLAIKTGGSKTHTLEALTALATYSETEPFTTRMTKEVDGVTNGVIIGLIQLMGQRSEEMLEFLKAGGLSKDPNFVYGEFISTVGNFDNYQRMAHSLIGYKDAFYNEIVASKGVAAKDRTKTANAFIKAGGTQASLDGLDFFV